MRLNDLKPASGSKGQAKRFGRSHSAGQGKTSGRGTKGQRSRAGGYHKVGFEGGQMPLQRRLPKLGFVSTHARKTAEVRVHELGRLAGAEVNLSTLKAAHLVPRQATTAKIFASGTLDKAVKVVGVKVTPGARKIIEAAGGSVE